MAFAGEIGWIGKACPDHPKIALIPRIMHSAAGYYIGTYCAQCRQEGEFGPFSRETHYYPNPEAIMKDLEEEKVRWRDAGYHPGPIEIIE